VTPFLSVVAALGICHFKRVKKIMYGFALYSILPLFVFFWIVPVKVNPEKFHVIHLAERLRSDHTADYRDTLAFIGGRNDLKKNDLQFVEWTPFKTGSEYRRVYDFYLSDTFVHWEEADFQDWLKDGQTPILLLTSPKAVKSLPRDSARWIPLETDKYQTLLVGVRN
jgi:hypothetical protein